MVKAADSGEANDGCARRRSALVRASIGRIPQGRVDALDVGEDGELLAEGKLDEGLLPLAAEAGPKRRCSVLSLPQGSDRGRVSEPHHFFEALVYAIP